MLDESAQRIAAASAAKRSAASGQASRGLPTPKNRRRGDYVAKSPPFSVCGVAEHLFEFCI
jgi:hypothetical protein